MEFWVVAWVLAFKSMWVFCLWVFGGRSQWPIPMNYPNSSCPARIILEYKLEFYDRFCKNIFLEYSREFYEDNLELRILEKSGLSQKREESQLPGIVTSWLAVKKVRPNPNGDDKVIKLKSTVIQSFPLYHFFTSKSESYRRDFPPAKIDDVDYQSPRIQRIKVVP